MSRGNAYYSRPPRHGLSRGTTDATALVARALDGFRRLYGVKARPEDCPEAWRAVVAECRADQERVEDYENPGHEE